MSFLAYLLSAVLTLGISGAGAPVPTPTDPALEATTVAGLDGSAHPGRVLAHKAKKSADRVRARRAAARKATRRATRRDAATAASDAEYARRNPAVENPFTVATFNALGSSHTDGRRPQRRGYAHSTARIRRALTAFDQYGLDVIGLQEFQGPQNRAFKDAAGGSYAVHVQGANAVAWRASRFELVATSTLSVPYFGGAPTAMPVVLLRDRTTAQEALFISVHNPADARGNAQKWRDAAVARELEYVRYARSIPAPIPVFLLGDMNDRERFFCPITATGDLHSASGGSNTPGRCTHPTFRGVDWVTGSTGVRFSQFRVDTSVVRRRISDHPLVMARAG